MFYFYNEQLFSDLFSDLQKPATAERGSLDKQHVEPKSHRIPFFKTKFEN